MENKKENKKVAVFEEVLPLHRMLIWVYSALGYIVFYHRVGPQLKESGWFQALLKKKGIEKISFDFSRGFLDGLADTEAFENVEKVYPQFLKDNPFLDKLRFLYENDDIELTFKLLLLKKLSRYYYLNFNISELSARFGKTGIWTTFVPVKSIPVYQMADLDISDYRYFSKVLRNAGALIKDDSYVRFPWWLTAVSALRNFAARVIVGFKIIGLSVLFLSKFVTQNQSQKKKYKHGFMVITPRQFENKIKSVDFLIDGEQIRKEEIIFIPYNSLNASQKEHMQKKSLHFIESIKDFQQEFSKKAKPYLWSLFPGIFRGDMDCLEDSLRLIFYYVKWSSLAEKIEIKNLISQNTDSVHQAVARDILFKNRGSRIWKYMDSASLANYSFPKKDFLRVKENVFVYLYCDYLVSWSDDNNEALKTTRSTIGNYLTVGCLWSEHARLIQEGKLQSDLRSEMIQNGYREGMKIIGVFDSSYNDNCFNTYQDGALFLDGIKNLMVDFPEVFFIIKLKRSQTKLARESQLLNSALEKLARTRRIYLTENSLSPSEVIAHSDLLISFPFTSPALEAMTIKKKSIWYDPSEKFRGSFYDAVPGLVCHGYKNLQERVQQLLTQTTQSQYEEYLKRHVEKYFCQWMDGHALTRFRKLLATENDHAEEPLLNLTASGKNN